MIAVALVHPDTPHAAAYLHGHQLGYTDWGWLRCETTAILGIWQPAYAMLTHAAAGSGAGGTGLLAFQGRKRGEAQPSAVGPLRFSD